jgi:4-alpha-glucanotransferase
MDVFARRRAGVLLHPTSLPGSLGNGDLGPDAYRFVDLLVDCRISLWQTLPLGPTHDDLSPYQCLSVHAGDFRLISLQLLVEQGWLDDADLDPSQDADRQRRLRLAAAHQGFQQQASAEEREAFARFACEHAGWLEDFALYQALRGAHRGKAWYQWPRAICDRQPAALSRERTRLAQQIEQVRFEQFLFYLQWKQLRRYANERGVLLFGDIPIFVAHDSADVWAQREWFSVDAHGQSQVVAGVPPDYFSATGQRWGNPHYHWDALQQDGYRWWVQRIRSQMEMFDLVRIDHFRGFEAYWEIDARAETAVDGRWVKGPGDSFFQALTAELGELPLVAEDLGVITPEVTALRERFGLPGMKILQFAFNGSPENPYLPHNHETLSVVYTGTHDNNTTLGWYQELTDDQRWPVHHYLGADSEPMPWLLIRAALASVARLAVIPMQDLLGLDGSHRMNVPGVADGNWRWRFAWDQVHEEHRARLRDWVHLYGRAP